MATIDPCTFLRRLPLFSDLGEEELRAVGAAATERHVGRGRTIVERGDPCEGFHSILYGQVKLAFISPQGQEKVIEILGPGKTFGEAVMFMEKPYFVTATALEDCLLLHVRKEAIFAELEQSAAFARRMLAGMSRRLHGLVADVEAYTLHTGGQRVVGYLLKDAPASGATVRLSVSKRLVASRLNITPEYFSRVLNDLTRRELVRVDGRDIAILDADGLRAYEG
ncbi:Crp/Fnr family transcriptional regulator [Massilia sp. CT11-137]|uniref:Crp/Fnr family transcriptional regulator n=1 Tax=Massilia sp. CT11-137 TaxID=3393901 RepID=UPI0039AF83F4